MVNAPLWKLTEVSTRCSGHATMAKKSAVLKNERRKKLIACYVAKYGTLKARVRDESLPQGERVLARLRIAKNPARRQPYPGPQPVRTHRSAAGL